MNTYERFQRALNHQEADRIPIIDEPWAGTLRRWHAEGMPEGVDWRDYFGIDKLERISVDITPRYEVKVLEDTDRYQIVTTPWGVTLKNFKELDSTPEFLDYKVTTPEVWAEAKARMTLDDDRIPWQFLKENYPLWRKEGRFVEAGFWFGFDVTHSWMAGTETILVAMYEEPEWVVDMFDTYLDRCMRLFERVWDAGYRFDAIHWYDDMGYKGTTFFSNDMYRELLKPVHRRAIEWAHDRGIWAHLHSCGNIMTRIDDLVEIGVDCLNPLEVKAGMEPLTLKKKYGDRLTLHGGINAVLWDDRDAIVSSIEETVPVLKEKGGYIFSSDHSIPNSVSLSNMKAIVDAVKKAGSY
ncbi:MAG: hypothetical protein J5849_02640 [Clostridia bacterium]|nr:hypothetical protein [Clostridia bacterium]